MECCTTWNSASDMLLQYNREMIYVGVFETDKFEPVSLSGSSCIRKPGVSSENVPTEQWMIEISPKQARGLYSHIKYGRTFMVQINIAKLQFVCLRHGTLNCLTGMSNFNMDDTAIQEVDRLLFSITNVHYTRQESLEGVHALNMAAMLVDDLLLVAICKASNISLIEKLKQLMLIKEGKLSLTYVQDIIEEKEKVNKNNNKSKVKDEATEKKNIRCILFDEGFPSDGTNDITSDSEIELTDIARVKMRASTKSDSEKKHDQLKRQTSFCEDWRTATIRSIEALQSIGPFGLNQKDNDKQPLMDDTGVFIAGVDGNHPSKRETGNEFDSDFSGEESDVIQTRNENMTDIADATFARKSSRVTLV